MLGCKVEALRIELVMSHCWMLISHCEENDVTRSQKSIHNDDQKSIELVTNQEELHLTYLEKFTTLAYHQIFFSCEELSKI